MKLFNFIEFKIFRTKVFKKMKSKSLFFCALKKTSSLRLCSLFSSLNFIEELHKLSSPSKLARAAGGHGNCAPKGYAEGGGEG